MIYVLYIFVFLTVMLLFFMIYLSVHIQHNSLAIICQADNAHIFLLVPAHDRLMWPVSYLAVFPPPAAGVCLHI